ncbi:MAG: hypothetical protein IPO87_17955, partial [Flavobacteriales bacterium]|nr:hypothetical protein [Flavobacteriales bacterium]
MRGASEKQKKLYALLREHAASGRPLSLERILANTGYKDTAIKPMISKGLVPWLHKTTKDGYTVQGFNGISLERFQEALSQRKSGPPRPATKHSGVFASVGSSRVRIP